MKSRVLLVDDDPGVRRMLLRVLEEEGYVVLAAANGLEALEIAAGNGLELVLLDLDSPPENGWHTFEKLTAENPALPVIIITSRPNQLFPALGAGALMEKPLDLPRLLKTVRDLLEEPAASQRARSAGKAAEFHYVPAQPSRLGTMEPEKHVA